jgi:hypothetical protein
VAREFFLDDGKKDGWPEGSKQRVIYLIDKLKKWDLHAAKFQE